MNAQPSMQTPHVRGNPSHADALTRRHTAFRSFAELTAAGDYVPTLGTLGAPKGETELADIVDLTWFARGDARRCYRGVR